MIHPVPQNKAFCVKTTYVTVIGGEQRLVMKSLVRRYTYHHNMTNGTGDLIPNPVTRAFGERDSYSAKVEEMQPNRCLVFSIHQDMPYLTCFDASDSSGLLFIAHSFTDTHVGKAIPFATATPLTLFRKICEHLCLKVESASRCR